MEEEAKRGRGRPRKPDHLLKRPRKGSDIPATASEELQPSIEVGDTASAMAALDQFQREEIERESKKAECAATLARHRWYVAKNYHRLEDGISRLNFDNRPFLVDIYQDPSQDITILGAAQWGKTEFLICAAAASAGLGGLKILYVLSKKDKRDRFVSSRVDPCFNSVPAYKRLFQAAHDRNAKANSTSVKHFGAGVIFFVYASAEREMTSWASDLVICDERQEANADNLQQLPDRLSGSPWGFWINAGHPSVPGSEQNQNLDYLYENSDAREWHIPCPHCRVPQVLDFWNHIIYEEKNKNGAILSIKPRDEEYTPGNSALDMRPICMMCHRPMNRLSREGFWKPRYPDRPKHGYRLSNLYNVNVRVDLLVNRYVGARHRPELMQEFFNKQLGIGYSASGTQITEKMLDECAMGELTNVKPYRFMPISQFDWEKLSAA